MSKVRQVLWISYCAPYDGVAHGGGQLHNFYVKKLAAEQDLKIRLVSFYYQSEKDRLDCDRYGIENDMILIDRPSVLRYMANALSKWNPFDKYVHCLPAYRIINLMKTLRRIKREGYCPDVIILEWTQITLLQKRIRRLFPNAKVVCNEVDVMFQAYQRMEQKSSNRRYWQWKVSRIKRFELSMLHMADLIVVNNPKDKALLQSSGLEQSEFFIWQAYYHDYRELVRTPDRNRIMFFGALDRAENYRSVIWFVEQVMPMLPDITFYVVGAKPPAVLKKLSDKHVILTGYVEDVGEYFSEALCMVAPLQLGAGIKIKVLEAMSAGVPVLTNSIGIEGIQAENGKDYLHCETPEEYLKAINNLQQDQKLLAAISRSASELMKTHYNPDISAKEFADRIRFL